MWYILHGVCVNCKYYVVVHAQNAFHQHILREMTIRV